MRIGMIADLHGNFPYIEPVDLLLIGGDICPHEPENRVGSGWDIAFQRNWIEDEFGEWLHRLAYNTEVVGIAGNHDFILEADPDVEKILPWCYLQDESISINGLTIYGSPWVPNLEKWAFFGGKGGRVADKWDKIPSGIDIFLSHGPPYNYGDKSAQDLYGDYNAGCKNMNMALMNKRPDMLVCGHIHEGYGHYHHPFVQRGVWNVSYVDEYYEPRKNGVVYIDW